MATRPTVGGSDGSWGTELNAHLDVSLDDDGKVDDGATQTTSAAPTADAELANRKFVTDQDAADHPAYTGGESHTDGSGLITKMGRIDTQNTTGTLTFGTAFPSGLKSIQLTNQDTTATLISAHVTASSTSAFSWRKGANISTLFWIAIGY